ncbi:hypothetical protein GPECTOR_94g660 [Gonium pectorale]|uniref:Uncharacterized protein n=1 Tax=Gonium pectorale TaxID=33097 RepID=A0A150G0H7_GONPE|nr:hypothetical protein GPECTOR_94g660 [Gonium pectorale]|eukprot:KXZ43338.1 hypothetical protein GPECTOR_94g660 [Gonium pectorale]
MADDGQPAPSGRGGGRGGARKFMPTMPGRRKKAEEGGAAADAAVSDEAFRELIKTAQSAGGAGRGRGRGRGQQRFQVTFGAFGDDRESLGVAVAEGGACGGMWGMWDQS